MRKSDQEQLLRDSLDDAGLEAIRQSTLAQGVRVLRRRTRRTRQVEALLLGAIPLLLVGLFAYRGFSVAPKRFAPTIQQTAGVKIINKEQLFALFPNRPIALIGKPGRQQVVFLDEVRDSARLQ